MIAFDKIKHFAVCFTITIVMPGGWILAVIMGTGKEIYDKYIKKTKFDWYDMIANGFGILTGLIIRYAYTL